MKDLAITVVIVVCIVFFIVMIYSTRTKPVSVNTSNISTKCINGVFYYMFTQRSGYKSYGFMAPVYDKNTKQIVTCGGYEE